jgi:sporulation protein YlmC with PRC-barrel domain
MSSQTILTEDDEGKRVVNARGDEVGRLVDVEHGNAYVDPDPGITETLMSKLGWGDGHDDDTYRLDPDHVETVTDDEIRLTH